MGDQFFKKERLAVERRRKIIQKNRSQKWLFVCEGKKTEVNYIKSLIAYYNERTEQARLIADVHGVGKNTKSLVMSVEDFLNEALEFKRQSDIPYEKVFVVFDRDSFKKEKFNAAITAAENRGYIPIWSNECFELWFLLHFNYVDSDMGREWYFTNCLNGWTVIMIKQTIFLQKFIQTNKSAGHINSQRSSKRKIAVKARMPRKCRVHK